MTRRRVAAVAIAAALAAGLGGAHVASAGPVDVTTPRERYWACVAVDTVDVGTCVGNPLPDPNDLLPRPPV